MGNCSETRIARAGFECSAATGENGLARRPVPCVCWKLAARSFRAGCKGGQCAESMHVVGLRVFFELLIFESADAVIERHSPVTDHCTTWLRAGRASFALNCHESHLFVASCPLAPLRTVTRPLCRLLPPYDYTTACYN